MKISKKTGVLITVYCLAAFAVFGGFLLKSENQLHRTRLLLQNSNRRALLLASEAADGMDTALQKCQRLQGGAALTSCCRDIQSCSLSARTALASLPLKEDTAGNIGEALSKIADYGCYLSRVAAGAVEPGDHQAEDLSTLQNISASLSASLSSLVKTWEGETFPGNEELCQCLQTIDGELPSLSGLQYDGVLSEKTEPAASYKTVSEKDALQTVLRFTKTESGFWQEPSSRRGKTPVLVFLAEDGSTAEVSSQTGSLLLYRYGGDLKDGSLDRDTCTEKAEKFLADMGFENMEATGWEKQNGKISLSFVYGENGIHFDPDKLLVSVSTDDGSIVGFQDMGYDRSHAGRTLPDTVPDPHSYDGHLCQGLTCVKEGLSVIASPGGDEILCCELVCRDEQGKLCMIHWNPETGQEENIFLLREDETGLHVK